VNFAPSLFSSPMEPVFQGILDWVNDALTGDLTTALCVVAVAFVGLVMTTGRLAVRDAARVVLGCFVLLGAPVIAADILRATEGTSAIVPRPSYYEMHDSIRLSPPDYDPYAGASLQTE